MPYRIDIVDPPENVVDALVRLGALDVEATRHGIAAIMPDSVAGDAVRSAVGTAVQFSKAPSRDEGSTWVITRRAVRVASWEIVPAESADARTAPDAIRVIDGPAFGTGLHPTTALCLEALDEELRSSQLASVLDVGTGSGVLALASLRGGVPRALALDIDGAAVRAAATNAQLNGVRSRLHVVHGGPEALAGRWPLVLANVLAAPLIEMAPTLTRCVAHRGRLILSGIPAGVEQQVAGAYTRSGMRHLRTQARGGWMALTLSASW